MEYYSVNFRDPSSIVRYDVPNLYDEYFEKLKVELKNVKFISLTSDSWSSYSNKHSLLSLTSHFWKNDELCYRVLGVIPIKGRHTAKNLSELIDNCLKRFEIEKNRIFLLLRDGASVMIKTSIECQINSLDCFAHKLQLVSNLICFCYIYLIF